MKTSYIMHKNLGKLFGEISAEPPLEVFSHIEPDTYRPVRRRAPLNPIASQDAYFERKELEKIALRVVKTLTPRESFIIIHVFGIGLSREYKQSEIAKLLGIHRARVSFLYLRSLRKLRHPCRSKNFLEYMQCQ
jgi:RNA polymerase sigma factor (sigma-70 family)